MTETEKLLRRAAYLEKHASPAERERFVLAFQWRCIVAFWVHHKVWAEVAGNVSPPLARWAAIEPGRPWRLVA